VGFCATIPCLPHDLQISGDGAVPVRESLGSGATGLVFLQGVSPTSYETAMKSAENEQVAKGAYYYKGKVVVPVLGDTEIKEVEIPLKDLPDGFDLEQERKNAYLIYANAIGVPVQDIQPLSGQGLGTGTQTVILAEAEEGQGMAAWAKQWEHHANEDVFPETTTFAWSERDCVTRRRRRISHWSAHRPARHRSAVARLRRRHCPPDRRRRRGRAQRVPARRPDAGPTPCKTTRNRTPIPCQLARRRQPWSTPTRHRSMRPADCDQRP
jgi:hypothetical protein